MPIYEYHCQTCGGQFDVRRAMKDADTPIDCPTCGSGETQRGISTFFASSGGSPVKGAGGSSSCGSCSASSCASCGGH